MKNLYIQHWITILNEIYINKLAKKKSYMVSIAKSTGVSVAHSIKTINILRDNGLLTLEKKGRIKHITLTKEGLKLSLLCHKIIAFLKNESNNNK